MSVEPDLFGLNAETSLFAAFSSSATQTVQARTRMRAAAAQAANASVPIVAPSTRTIALEMRQTPLPTPSNVGTGLDLAVNLASGSRVLSPASPNPPPQQQLIALVRFDVDIYASAFATSAHYTQRPRQNTHQTFAGFYVDELGLMQGQLALEAFVILGSPNLGGGTNDPTQQLQQFQSFLALGKRVSPLSTEAPFEVRYHDVFVGASYRLNLQLLDFEQHAGDPLRGFLTLQAEILEDFGSEALTGNPPLTGSTGATSSDQVSLLEFAVGGVESPPLNLQILPQERAPGA